MSRFQMPRHLCVCAGLWLLVQTLAAAAPAAEPLPAIDWRLVGPFRGGWSTMAVGVPELPDTYYSGAAGGGVWKTTDAGRTWQVTSDATPIAGVGALAVAPSDPNVIYVGTGQPEPRYDIVAGSGVYRSADAGKSWQSVGLQATRHIGALLVDRRDANTVLVAALGHAFGPNPERGIYRSQDGGAHWEHTLIVDDSTGAVDLAADPENPDLIYAATWTMRVWPWLSYFTPAEGPGSAIYRSLDGGRHWQRLGGVGWPSGPLGRIGLAVTRKGGASRIYATVARSENGGLYRSDDGGAHWVKGAAMPWGTGWYTARLTVEPEDPDTVYTVGQSTHVSHDAGLSFAVLHGGPGGDDYHYLWINPKDPKHRVTAGDQGTQVSVNGGVSWSDWYNQPTGQFYYLATDDRFPYWIYSGQQDSGTVAIASRSDYGSISLRDWHPVGSDERDYDLPFPGDANIVFGTGLGGRITRYNQATGEKQNVSPWPIPSYGERATDFRYHYNWFTPIAFSKQAPYTLYAGAQLLFRSTDQGTHWEAISPDLSGREPKPRDCGGNPEPARAYACGYGSINTIVPAGQDARELWVGTDDGLVWLTRDAGQHWSKVTPPSVPVWAKISSIDLRDAAPGTAYVAVDNHRQDDVRPRAYRTSDYGATWTEIGAGLPQDRFLSVVRADPVRAGLLYAGTELGVQVSFDDGAHWQSLDRKLPPVWVHDLLVKDRDLIAATNGRAIWVLDDLAPLRQRGRAPAGEPRLYAPSPAYRLRINQNYDTPFTKETPLGRNPPTGAIIDYLLPEAAKGPVELEIHDAKGMFVRRFSSTDGPEDAVADAYFSADWLPAPATLSGTAGAHRFVWNLRLPPPRAIKYHYSIAASPAEGTILLPAGSLALPGEYRVTLKVDGRTQQAPLTIRPDPRVATPVAGLAEAIAFDAELAAGLASVWQGYAEIGAVREQLIERRKALPASSPLAARLAAFEALLQPLVSGSGEASTSLAFHGEMLAGIATDVEGADRAPTQAQREAARLATGRATVALARWQTVRSGALVTLNRQLAAAHLAPVVVPAPGALRSAQPPEGEDQP